MEYINRVEITGHIGNVSTSRIQDRTLTRFALATNEVYERGGDKIIQTHWFTIESWDAPTLSKGDSVLVKGRLRSVRYTDAQGIERSATHIMASEIHKIDRLGL